MANINDKLSQRWPSHVDEKFVPTSFWSQDSEENYLLDVHLPGFKHEEVRIELASDDDHIKIEGERLMDNNKCLYIDETFPLPENSDIGNIVGNFEGEHLYIKVPKPIIEEDGKNIRNGNNSTVEESSQEQESNKKQKNKTKHEQGDVAAGQNNHDSNKKETSNEEICRVANFPEEIIKKWEGQDNPLEIAINCLKENKGIFLLAIISFSIGVWVSKLW